MQDKVGNWSLWSSTNIIKVDITPPVGAVTLLSPVNNLVTNNLTQTFIFSSVADALSGITNYKLIVTNYSGWTTNIVNTTTNIISSIKEDTNLWFVYAYDRAGNYTGSVSTNMIVIDTVIPAPVTLLSPTNNALITNKAGIDYIWSSGFDAGVGVTNYTLAVTNLTTGWSTNVLSDATNIMLPNRGEGIYEWFVIDYDKAGNFAFSTTNQFTVDTNAPSKVTLVAPTNNTSTNSKTGIIDFVWNTAVDTMSGVLYYELQISTNNFVNVWSNVILTTTNVSITGLEFGNNWWRVRAIDYAGHYGEWSTTNLLVYSEYIELAYFRIMHNTNAFVSSWTPVTISVIATNNLGMERILTNYSGTITIEVYGTSASIDMTNLTGNGIFGTNIAGAEYIYQFVASDNGVVTLNIRDATAESINIDIKNGIVRDENDEGPLYFWLTEPFIVSISQPGEELGYRYITVDEITPIEIRFSLLIDETTINTNTINFMSEVGWKSTGVSFTIITNTAANNWKYTIIRLYTGLSPIDDILNDYWINITTNVASTNGNKLVTSPYNSRYAAPYWSRSVSYTHLTLPTKA